MFVSFSIGVKRSVTTVNGEKCVISFLPTSSSKKKKSTENHRITSKKCMQHFISKAASTGKVLKALCVMSRDVSLGLFRDLHTDSSASALPTQLFESSGNHLLPKLFMRVQGLSGLEQREDGDSKLSSVWISPCFSSTLDLAEMLRCPGGKSKTQGRRDHSTSKGQILSCHKNHAPESSPLGH